ncbi:MAG: S9 family peptidase [Burkholderiales bacterium]|nr:S9 family peptidase [Burkholderiales bacterium]
MRINRRQAGLALAATISTGRGWGQTSAASLAPRLFFEPAALSAAALNPTGTHVALCQRAVDGRRRLGVVELDTLTHSVFAVEDRDIVAVQWINDRRLIYRVADEQDPEVTPTCLARDLGSTQVRDLGPVWPMAQGPQDSEHMMVGRFQDRSEGWGFLKLSRLDTRNGREEELEVPPWSRDILLDPRGAPVAVLTAKGDSARLLWRREGAWQVVRESERFFDDDFALEGMAPDGTAYVSARNGLDRRALYSIDPVRGALSERPVLALEQYDVEGELIFGGDRLLGMRVEADARTTVWFDPGMKAIQERIDARLTSTGNLLTPPRRGDSPWILVSAFSDRQPTVVLAYHRGTDKLTVLGRSRPAIDPAQMSPMSFHWLTARDGRPLPCYLSLPRSAGARRPLPMVVLVHGGPFVRGGSWAWDSEVQFLASRGYAVLQPEFRGSTGFGNRHATAGWRQWGAAMQDDLADAARWAVSQGIADAARIAIAGSSYGGYAAMMGLARQSDLFACAVNWLGVTDLDLLYSAHWSDLPKVFKEHGLPKVLGDRQADARMLREHSPLHVAAQIRKPVLMAYGERDRRVPIEHGERLRDALKLHNPNMEWVSYPKEGHGWSRLSTQIDFWERVERFLARHLPATPA